MLLSEPGWHKILELDEKLNFGTLFDRVLKDSRSILFFASAWCSVLLFDLFKRLMSALNVSQRSSIGTLKDFAASSAKAVVWPESQHSLIVIIVIET